MTLLITLATTALVFGQPRRNAESIVPPLGQTQQSQAQYPKRMVQNALNETSQARAAATRERLGKHPAVMRVGTPGTEVGTLNTTQSLLHHEHGGGMPGEEKIWIGWQVCLCMKHDVFP